MSSTNVQMRPKPASDAIYSGFSGLAVMAAVAGGEGLVAGGVLGIVEGLHYGNQEPVFMMAIGGIVCAMVVGAPIGFICFALVEMLCRRIPDEAVKRAQQASIKGSIFGVGIGGLLAILLTSLIPEGMGMNEVEMYIPGVILGFIGGTLGGGINRARMELDDYEEPEALTRLHADDDDGSLLVDITSDLDQVHVRVTGMDRDDRATRAGTGDGTFDDRDPLAPKVIDRISDGHGGDQTEIGGAGGGMSRLRLELSPDLMQVDLLITEGERPPLITERHGLHAEDARIEPARGADVGDGGDQMADAIDVIIYLQARAELPMALALPCR